MAQYDDPTFFEQYSQMSRSKMGLQGAGEWHELQAMLPDLTDKRVLDLGCGYGWHCIYAAEKGAQHVVGVDLSQKMLNVAKEKTTSRVVEYKHAAMEDIDFPTGSFDTVISSLAFHYVESFSGICEKVKKCLVEKGEFVFSVENPIFTAYGTGDWYYDTNGEILHWPVDNYFTEGSREAHFLGSKVVKYHKTVATYINTLIEYGFTITKVVEPLPPKDMLGSMPNEARRPMMLLISAKKN
ncbi:methyltransferase domain protein [Backusella circina FSU 941]|nr:methyltransferase domain protein [Backusella circina FSU 941]